MIDVGAAAAINATISSIVLAALSLWASAVVGELASQKRRILESADKVNQLPDTGSMGAQALANDPESIRQSVKDFVMLGMGVGPHAFDSADDNRGQRFMSLMTSLAAHYPFRRTMRPSEEGGVVIGGAPELVEFKSIDDVTRWVQDAESLTGQVEWLFSAHRGKVGELISAADAAFRPLGPDLDRLGQHLSPGALSDIAQYFVDNPRVAASLTDAFLLKVGGLSAIAVETRGYLQIRQAYLGRTQWRRWLLIGAGLSVVSLFTGAVIPMLFPHVSGIVYLWVPGLIYLASGLMGLGALARALASD
ncbi:MAG TPA: hypothetical protein VGN19_02905 [Pedococcus sp.]|jgi:hypothetical protein|nr:hypothetical protein [Pedococcus sp.]